MESSWDEWSQLLPMLALAKTTILSNDASRATKPGPISGFSFAAAIYLLNRFAKVSSTLSIQEQIPKPNVGSGRQVEAMYKPRALYETNDDLSTPSIGFICSFMIRSHCCINMVVSVQ